MNDARSECATHCVDLPGNTHRVNDDASVIRQAARDARKIIGYPPSLGLIVKLFAKIL